MVVTHLTMVVTTIAKYGCVRIAMLRIAKYGCYALLIWLLAMRNNHIWFSNA